MAKKFILFLIIVLFSTSVFADYIVTGKISGQVCKFGILCSFENFDAVKKDNKFYSIKKRYSKVSDYKNGRCWINIKSKKWGLFSDGINLFKGGFYQKQPNGSYKKFKLDYITFPCKKS